MGTTRIGIMSYAEEIHWGVREETLDALRGLVVTSGVDVDPASTAVQSEHDEGFGRIGDGLEDGAWAPDGTVEALEDPTRRSALAVISHPERGDDLAPFRALTDVAARCAEECPQ